MNYFIAMIDYGRRGREAVVDPEVTRNELLARIRSGDLKNIIFIHEVEFSGGRLTASDVTDEIMAEAGMADRVFA
jgi:hypothetical protein